VLVNFEIAAELVILLTFGLMEWL